MDRISFSPSLPPLSASAIHHIPSRKSKPQETAGGVGEGTINSYCRLRTFQASQAPSVHQSASNQLINTFTEEILLRGEATPSSTILHYNQMGSPRTHLRVCEHPAPHTMMPLFISTDGMTRGLGSMTFRAMILT